MPPEPVIINAAPLITGLVLEVDGWPNRRHTSSASIGTEPLENGSEVTDHVVRLPRLISLTGIVSTVFDGDRPAAAQAALNRLTGVVVEVITEWETVPEMLILSARTGTEGRDMQVVLDLQEIVRVAAPVEVPELSAAARAATARAAATRDESFFRTCSVTGMADPVFEPPKTSLVRFADWIKPSRRV